MANARRWIICALLLLTVAACGGGDGGDDGGGSSSGGSGGDSSGGGDSSPTTRIRATAGSNRDVVTGTRVMLDASNSTASDGERISFEWRLTSRPDDSDARLVDADTPTPEFTADVSGQYAVEVTVTGGDDGSDTDSITITATDGETTPVADAGPNQNVETGATVELDGSASSDADGDGQLYFWRFIDRPDGSSASLSNNQTATPTFTADEDGEYVVELRVADGRGGADGRDADRVTITAASPNAAPNAEAGNDVTVAPGSTAELDGTNSTDPNGDSLSYDWRIVSLPDDSSASIASPNSGTPSITTDQSGDYVLELTVSDGEESDSDRVVVSADRVLQLLVDQNNPQTTSDTDYQVSPNRLFVNFLFTEAGNGTEEALTVRRFQLNAIGRSFTVRNIDTMLEDSSNDTAPQLTLDGVTSGDTIARGDTLDFTADLGAGTQPGSYRFSTTFTVAETGVSYRINYQIIVRQ